MVSFPILIVSFLFVFQETDAEPPNADDLPWMFLRESSTLFRAVQGPQQHRGRSAGTLGRSLSGSSLAGSVGDAAAECDEEMGGGGDGSATRVAPKEGVSAVAGSSDAEEAGSARLLRGAERSSSADRASSRAAVEPTASVVVDVGAEGGEQASEGGQGGGDSDCESSTPPLGEGGAAVEERAGGGDGACVTSAEEEGEEGVSMDCSATDGGGAECWICFTGPREAVLLSCGHGGICYPCAERCWKMRPRVCPLCREKVVGIAKVAPNPADPRLYITQR